MQNCKNQASIQRQAECSPHLWIFDSLGYFHNDCIIFLIHSSAVPTCFSLAGDVTVACAYFIQPRWPRGAARALIRRFPGRKIAGFPANFRYTTTASSLPNNANSVVNEVLSHCVCHLKISHIPPVRVTYIFFLSYTFWKNENIETLWEWCRVHSWLKIRYSPKLVMQPR